MSRYYTAIAVLLVATGVNGKANFNQFDGQGDENPAISQLGWQVTMTGRGTGIPFGETTVFYGRVEGDVETKCFNGGNNEPPGKNKYPFILDGSVKGTTDGDHKGNSDYTLVMSEECGCGIPDDAEFDWVYGKGKDKTTASLACGGPDSPYFEDPYNVPNDGGVCCDRPRPDDGVTCGGDDDCECRVGDFMKGDSDCPEVKGKNAQFALYALGLEVRRTIVDLVSYVPDKSTGEATAEVATVKRQECFTRNVPYVKDDTTGLIDRTEVECYQCLICQENGGGVGPCGAYTAEAPLIPLTDGCKDYSTEPASPTGPEVVRRLRA